MATAAENIIRVILENGGSFPARKKASESAISEASKSKLSVRTLKIKKNVTRNIT